VPQMGLPELRALHLFYALVDHSSEVQPRVTVSEIKRVLDVALEAAEDRDRMNHLERCFAELKPGREMAFWRDRTKPTETVRGLIDAKRKRPIALASCALCGGNGQNAIGSPCDHCDAKGEVETRRSLSERRSPDGGQPV
jgi:hypothetical protein